MQIYASPFMTSSIILFSFVFLNLESMEREINYKNWISWEQKELLMKQRIFFTVFEGLLFGENKNLIKNSRHKL